MKLDYDVESKRLARAVDIAIDSFCRYPPKDYTKENLDHTINVYSEWKNSILNPEPKFRKIASLKYHIQDVFTYFQEGSGEAVEQFWKEIAIENLGYVRVDRLGKIIDRGIIKGRIEYELVQDSLISAQQVGRITEKEAKQLSEMLGRFESKGRKTTIDSTTKK